MPIISETRLPNLYYRGKVRDTYHLDGHLLMVATDRVSAFDSVLPTPIPDKGKVLNLLSAFWFEKTAHIVPNHLVAVVDSLDSLRPFTVKLDIYPLYLVYRSMVIERAERIPVESVVRGYLSGSAWAEYRQHGTVGGQPMPSGLQESDVLPEPMFTPTTKAQSGHDQPITLDDMANEFGEALAQEMMEKTIAIYRFAAEYARERGLIIADTKMEFGLIDGQLRLIDELLTPDASRFWDVAEYRPGGPQHSFDKQYLRDWLIASGWDREPPAPVIHDDAVAMTSEKYREAYRRLTGSGLPPG